MVGDAGIGHSLGVTANLELELTATPDEVSHARHAVTVLCEELGLDDDVVERVTIAVNEACTNCVLHAYEAEPEGSTYMLETRLEHDALFVVVHDCGLGVARRGRTAGLGLGLGMRMIEAMADDTSVESQPGRGTRVAMRFAVPARR
jgi:anti-sigma regulatory factor (Ser/Thr protein kinase)